MTATIINLAAVRNARRQPEPAKPEPDDYEQQFLDLFIPASHPLAVASRRRSRLGVRQGNEMP